MHRAGENDAHVDQNIGTLAPLRALRHLDTSDARHVLHSSNSAHAPSRLHSALRLKLLEPVRVSVLIAPLADSHRGSEKHPSMERELQRCFTAVLNHITTGVVVALTISTT